MGDLVIRVPVMAYEEIDAPTFRARVARTLRPQEPPQYDIDDIVTLCGFSGNQVPALIIGVEPRVGGWHYHCVHVRYDGQPERIVVTGETIKEKKEQG